MEIERRSLRVVSAEFVVVGGQQVGRQRKVATRFERSPNGLVSVGAVVMEPVVHEALVLVVAMVAEWESWSEGVLVNVPLEAKCRIKEKDDVVGRIASVGECVVVVDVAKCVVACEVMSLVCVRSWETYAAAPVGRVLWVLLKEVVVKANVEKAMGIAWCGCCP